jgi:hypothetical protein
MSRNILTLPYSDGDKAENGLTFSVNADGSVNVSGTAEALTYYYFYPFRPESAQLTTGTGTFTFSVRYSGRTAGNMHFTVGFTGDDEPHGGIVNIKTVLALSKSDGSTYTYTGAGRLYGNVFVDSGETVECTIYPQLEAGSVVTEWVAPSTPPPPPPPRPFSYDDVLQAVIDMAEQAAGVPIVIGSNPPQDGIAITGNSSSASIFLDIGSDERMTVLCNGKNGNQQTIIQQLDAIHRALTRRKDYPHGDSWQIYAIETVASPRFLGRENNGRFQWLYGSSLLVKFNTKGI